MVRAPPPPAAGGCAAGGSGAAGGMGAGWFLGGAGGGVAGAAMASVVQLEIAMQARFRMSGECFMGVTWFMVGCRRW